MEWSTRVLGDRRKGRQTLMLVLIGIVAIFGIYEYVTASHLKSELLAVQHQVQNLGASGATLASAPTGTIEGAVAKASPAVVSIVVSQQVPEYNVEYQNPFGGRLRNFTVPTYKQVGTTEEDVGAGSGFIVRSDGYIVTNRHVVDTDGASYTVILANDVQKTAQVVYRDDNADIAVLKIDGSNYPTAPLGDSSSLAPGQQVVAIGNALGEYSNSVSQGIVSGLNRSVDAEDGYGASENLSGVIQTDAAINPGNSGGPLLDLSGHVVGVNVATIVGSSNIAFAIPANTVQTILNKVLQ